MVVVGLELVSTYRPTVNIVWPGVEEVMQECLPQNVEVCVCVRPSVCMHVCGYVHLDALVLHILDPPPPPPIIVVCAPFR